MALRPIYKPTMDECALVTGELVFIDECCGPDDISIKLKGDKHRYYINRGTKSGLIATALHEKLANTKITLHYPKHWTPLDPFGKMRHVARVTYNGTILYNEIEIE